jgi:hypothetical protein
MRSSVSSSRGRYVESFPTAWECFLICVIQMIVAGSAFAENASTPFRHAATPLSAYVVDGLALSARVSFERAPYRGYQCNQSELFPDLIRCQRTQRQQDWGSHRSFDITDSILHDRDGKAVYINRHVAPWTIERNEIQAELKAISSKLGERPREMRLPQREGLQAAVIATWGKIELTQLDADATAILAAGDSPRKGLLVDYLGNLRRSAQLGLPIYSISGGAGYLWSASVDRNSRGHIRVLAVDPAALPGATAAATAALAAPEAELPVGESLPKNETAATEKANSDTEPVLIEAKKTSTETEIAKTEIAEAAVPEPDKVAPLLARLEAVEVESRLMQRLTRWALGGLTLLLIIATSLLLRMRKRLRAAEIHISTSATQSTSSAQRAQTSQTECRAPQSQLSSEQIAAEASVVAKAEAGANAVQFERRKEQKQYINSESGSQKQDTQLVAVSDKEVDRAQPPSAEVTACVRCSREVCKHDKFCVHCGAPVVPERRDSTTMRCPSCRQEISTSDLFCRHCGASSSAPATPNGDSASPDCIRDHHNPVDEVVSSPRVSVRKKRTRKRAHEPMATFGHGDTTPSPTMLKAAVE